MIHYVPFNVYISVLNEDFFCSLFLGFSCEFPKILSCHHDSLQNKWKNSLLLFDTGTCTTFRQPFFISIETHFLRGLTECLVVPLTRLLSTQYLASINASYLSSIATIFFHLKSFQVSIRTPFHTSLKNSWKLWISLALDLLWSIYFRPYRETSFKNLRDFFLAFI